MKKTVVIFEQVRDCPDYVDGDCYNDGKLNGQCIHVENGKPPHDCPLEDA